MKRDPEPHGVDGPPQAGLDLHQSDGALVHSRVEHLVPGLAAGLGAIQGDVGIAQYVLRTLVTGGAEGDAGADGGEDLVGAEGERLGQRVLATFGGANGGGVLPEALAEQGEPVAAGTGPAVAGPEDR